MNYLDLRTQISGYLNRSDLSNEQLDVFIDNAEAEFNSIIRHRKMIKRVTADIDSHFTRLPSDFLEATNLQLNTNPAVLLRQASAETIDATRIANGDVTGTPEFYAIIGDTLEVVPRPSGTMTLEISYYSKIPALNQTTTTNWLIEDYPNIYLYGAMKHGLIFLMDDERLPVIAGNLAVDLERLNTEADRASFSGNSLTMKRRIYGGRPRRRVLITG